VVTLRINGVQRSFDGDGTMPLLWYLRDELGLTGTKFGCGMALCGACTVHVNGAATRACVTPMSTLEGANVTTIEGLSAQGTHPVQVAWREYNVPQCGYCQTGQIMQAAALLAEKPQPTDEEIDTAMTGNICRCGTYARIRLAVRAAAVAEGRCEVWAPTQGTRDTLAQVLGIPAERVRVNVTLLGGGFGRKSKPDFVVEAALLSREVGAPVKVTWTREDDIQHGYYHAVAAQHLEAGLDEQGRTIAWLHRTAFPAIPSTFAAGVTYGSDTELGLGFSDLPYDIPNIRLENAEAAAHVRIGWYRSVNNIQHAFAICSFADELAHAAGRDPKDYLLALIGAPRHVDLTRGGVQPWNYGDPVETYPIDTGRHRRVVELLAERAGWGRPLPAGRGRGIAVHRSFLAYVGAVADVEVSRDGQVTIPRLDVAIDCGFVAHPERVRAQMEGGAIMSLGNALVGQITFAQGRAQQSNFHDYQVLRMAAAPRATHVHIVPSDAPPSGVGETAVPPVAPALCNAIFAATGKRIRTLPIGKQLAS
jgi:isoquinoline 1-oxidoreductase beta subunit